MRKVIAAVVGWGIVGAVAVALFAPGGSLPVEQVGYFKGEDRDRVLAYRAARDLTEAEARDLMARLPWTAGRIPVAAISTADPVPQDILTLHSTQAEAIALTANPPFDHWQWRMWINPAGDRTLTGQAVP